MLFNSLQFLVFFAVLFLLYYNIPNKYRWVLLLIGSCYFYMAFIPAFILILFFLITVDYFLGIKISESSGRKKKLLLWGSIAANLGTLFFFKYFNFFNENIAYVAHVIHWNYPVMFLQIALPLGLSFHVFQSLSYVIEVYRGKYVPERNFGVYALYVMFFPQLVAGPIERPQHLLPQFKLEHNFDASNVRRGLERMLWGFFKKLVIADQISVIINPLFANTPSDGPTLILMAALFTYQLYCDFSGYSDIALGSAMVFGYDLTDNFNRPFASRSIADFWRRWHISLSNWLKDYLYYPLVFASKKISKLRLYTSIFITFTLIGLWHGANWTYVVFGGLHGFYMVFGSLTEKARQKLADLTSAFRLSGVVDSIKIITIFILVTFSLIFFRSKDMEQALYIISHLGNGLSNLLHYSYLRHDLFRGSGIWRNGLLLVVLLSATVMEVFQYVQAKHNTFYVFDSKPKAIRYAWYYALILMILFFGYFGARGFIYFQF